MLSSGYYYFHLIHGETGAQRGSQAARSHPTPLVRPEPPELWPWRLLEMVCKGARLLQGKGWAKEWQVVWACLSETPGAPQLS